MRHIIEAKFEILLLALLLLCPVLAIGQAQPEQVLPGGWTSIDAINTADNEFSPTLSPDGSYMIFSSDRPGGLGDQDLWISYFSNGRWSVPGNMRELNSGFHDQTPFITYDGKGLVFSSDRDGGYGVGDLYYSARQGDRWSAPRNLGPVINTKDSEKMPSLSMDNEELYFCRAPVDYVSRSVQSEKIQIFISKKSDSIWLTPEKIGPPVNMMTYDSAPRIMPDGKTLLFCSARPGGMGGYDIWKVERDNRFSAWTRASNLGAVNTTNNEAYFAFTIDASRMFLSARWSMDRKYDIYAYSMEAKFAAPTVTLQGRVTNLRTGKIVAADILLESFSNKKYSVKIQNDQFSGKYSITLPAGDRYSLTVQATGFMFDSRELDLRELKKSSVTNVSFGLKPLEKGEKIVVDTVYFDPDSWVLRQESELALYKMAQILKDNPAVCLLINGHVAKAVGARGKPQLVSEMRAREVMKFLVDHGIDQSRLKARGFGDTQPIGDNATEEGRIRNRRTEFEIIRSE